MIEQFISSLTPDSKIDDDWQKFVEKKKIEELEKIIREENLNEEKTKNFVKKAFSNGYISIYGTDIAEILPPISRFEAGGQRNVKKEIVQKKLSDFFSKFFDISG